ncbi:MAG: MFS transporter [Candidatus Microsaccharimonas sp.]
MFLRRHFWRHATFSEIAELYTSRMLRLAALHLAGAFMSIYMYQVGYGVGTIALFWSGFFLFKIFVSLPVASIVAKIGPKHAILLSNILYIPSMIIFAFLPVFGPWLLVLIVILQGASGSMYVIAYNIDFSKVKSIEHAGKEIAYMNIIEKITTSISPLIGGILAFLFGPQLVLIVAAVLFALAAAPLLTTGEQVKTGMKLQFRGFPWRLIRQHWLAQLAAGFDVFTSGTVWTLYTAVIVIGVSTSNNNVYIISGMLLSVVLLAALSASYVYGKLIDKKRGGDLMKVSVVANSLTHLVRPFITTPITVAGINAANEVATTGYTMPYTRAVYDNADLSGHRTTYLGLVDMLGNFGAFLGALVLAILVSIAGDTFALTNFFFVAGVVVLLVLTAHFPLYKR